MIEYRVIPPPQQASLPVSTGALTLSRQGDSQTSTCASGAATGSTRKAPADRQRHDSGRLARSFNGRRSGRRRDAEWSRYPY